MSDWDFLYEMKDRGYSEADIQDAMALLVLRHGNGTGLKNKKAR